MAASTSSSMNDGVGDRVLTVGYGDGGFCDNSVRTSKYTFWSFFPVAIGEQFRRKGNVYFLVMGLLMALGYYTSYFDSAISPWTTLGPLAVVISISLIQEGVADLARHRGDMLTNHFSCTVLQRGDANNGNTSGGSGGNNGEVVSVEVVQDEEQGTASPSTTQDARFQVQLTPVERRNIRVGHLVLVRNRDMIPADLVLLASSGDNGGAYIETSSIDGETNLKLRSSAKPLPILESTPEEEDGTPEDEEEKSIQVRPSVSFDDEDQGMNVSLRKPSETSTEKVRSSLKPVPKFSPRKDTPPPPPPSELESLEQAIARISKYTVLGCPDGASCLLLSAGDESHAGSIRSSPSSDRMGGGTGRLSSAGIRRSVMGALQRTPSGSSIHRASDSTPQFVAMLTCEQPNASVNTFSGKLSVPPLKEGDGPLAIPLNAENFLLRGAFLRNTEWAIGVACFTGADTKLVMNSSSPPSRLSQLDKLVNRTILIIITIMMLFVIGLSLIGLYETAHAFDNLWYVGYHRSTTQPWPYLPHLTPPKWEQESNSLLQNLFLFTTLLNNFVPLSLYITMEFVTRAMMLFINNDLSMYYKKNDTPANARSTTVTDLGQVKYVFSDKTGTLTQNIMRFKRCSVDGMIFGAPILKAAPSPTQPQPQQQQQQQQQLVPAKAFHPLRRLLVNAGISPPTDGRPMANPQQANLTFNAEMFLRVMSLCHTVVVEKDHDAPEEEDELKSSLRPAWLRGKSFSHAGARKKKLLDSIKEEGSRHGEVEKQKEEEGEDEGEVVEKVEEKTEIVESMVLPLDLGKNGERRDSDNGSLKSVTSSVDDTPKNKKDGAPIGQSYQAESPDEGALVSAASIVYGFQLLGRDSTGVTLSCSVPSLLSHNALSSGLKNGRYTAKSLASASVSQGWDDFLMHALRENGDDEDSFTDATTSGQRVESWSVLAVNKFDSARKRMSVVVRSPPELGSIPMLLCKGADSSMLNKDVCACGEDMEDESKVASLLQGKDMSEGQFLMAEEMEADEFELGSILAIQSHLGDFASEGLRTLVLGVRILTEGECTEWLARHAAAAASIKGRDAKLTQVALDIERNIHIVGVTAIEDKLQRGVPETISNLATAGIKLWVLTGDKRETAIEIGYSTKVLTPNMNLFQVACDSSGSGQSSATRIRTTVANQFMRLVKTGELMDYQRSRLEKKGRSTATNRFFRWYRIICRWWKLLNRVILLIFLDLPCRLCGRRKRNIFAIEDEEEEDDLDEDGQQKFIQDPVRRRQQVRSLAEEIMDSYRSNLVPATVEEKVGDLMSPLSQDTAQQREIFSDSEDPPSVFNRAASAKAALEKRNERGPSAASLRSLSIASLTSRTRSNGFLLDEDALSMASFRMEDDISQSDKFAVTKPSRILEQLFAVDSDVRHGRLNKHHDKKKQAQESARTGDSNGDASHPFQHTETIEVMTGVSEVRASNGSAREVMDREAIDDDTTSSSTQGPRALIIEGAALSYFLGNPLLEEMIFSVASCCDAVIACRVSPKQKALLVKMVRTYVSPVPMTLAIGDGANDVGMIQQAHVGIGISGLEGQQAVNASDFSIAQFRFLEELMLIHGRWNFTRMARVVLFSFYKNAVLAGLMVLYAGDNLYSGTTLFDEWVISMFNFVCSFPILFVGLFDRDIERWYVQKHPELYGAGPHGEELSLRKVFRWVSITLVHIFALYFISVPTLSVGGSISSAWKGLMRTKSTQWPGDGEGDYYTFGTTIYTVLVFTLAYKALYETRSIINGQWPLRCGKSSEPCWSRLPYTWLGAFVLSIAFYIGAVFLYEFVATKGNPSFTPFIGAVTHTFRMRSITWMVVLLVPVAATVFDVAMKVFANFYFPTQTQIHAEIAAKEKKGEAEKKKTIAPVELSMQNGAHDSNV